MKPKCIEIDKCIRDRAKTPWHPNIPRKKLYQVYVLDDKIQDE